MHTFHNVSILYIYIFFFFFFLLTITTFGGPSIIIMRSLWSCTAFSVCLCLCLSVLTAPFSTIVVSKVEAAISVPYRVWRPSIWPPPFRSPPFPSAGGAGGLAAMEGSMKLHACACSPSLPSPSPPSASLLSGALSSFLPLLYVHSCSISSSFTCHDRRSSCSFSSHLCRVHRSFTLQEWRAALDGFIRIRSSRSSSSSNIQNLLAMRIKLRNTADSIPSFPSLHRKIHVPPSGPSSGGNRGRKRFMLWHQDEAIFTTYTLGHDHTCMTPASSFLSSSPPRHLRFCSFMISIEGSGVQWMSFRI